MTTIILKFGSSVLRSDADLPRAVGAIYREVRAGRRVVAVASAFGATTDRLIQIANETTMGAATAHPGATAALLATGEEHTTARLVLALGHAGVPAESLDPARAGFRTRGPLLDADPVGVDVDRFRAAFARAPVVVVPGFIGRARDGRISLLGRGGSDLTALFLADALDATCRLLKDVDGLYERDPADGGPSPARYASIAFDDAERLDAAIVQPKAIRFAADHKRTFEVGAIGGRRPTVVGTRTVIDPRHTRDRRPLRVALLGCGTVGGALYERLAAEPERFDVTTVAVRDAARVRDPAVPRSRLTTDVIGAATTDVDIVVETIGGCDVARTAVEAALVAGRHVVTANKSLIASDGARLRCLAKQNDVLLRYAASVGGAVPMVEAVSRVAAVETIVGLDGVVARARLDGDRVSASVRLERLDPTDPLARTRGADNCLIIHTAKGARVIVGGAGAGGVPTATALFGDLEDVETHVASIDAAAPTEARAETAERTGR